MGFLNDIKKLFFGAKSVGKGAAKRTVDYSKKQTEHLLDVTDDYVSDKKDIIESKFDDLKDKTSKKSEELFDTVKSKTTEIIEDISESEAYKKTVETVEKVGDKILDTGENFIEKSKELIDGPGKAVAEKFKETSEDIGEIIFTGGKTIIEKASDATKNLSKKLDETIKKSEELASKEEKSDSEFADTSFEIKDTELKDDFFDKADKFASGDYSDKSEPRILDNKSINKKESIDIDGFVDNDNDGNPLIDDAKIIEDNTKSKKI